MTNENPAHENPDHLDTVVDAPASTRTVGAPVAGAVVALADVDDPVFSSGALGRGAAVEPADGRILAPVDGEIVTVMPHAYGIRGGGLEVLVHVGIDTVELGGLHFAPLVELGTLVRAGDALGTADVPAIAAAGYKTTVVVVLTNTHELGDVVITTHANVAAGDALLTVTV